MGGTESKPTTHNTQGIMVSQSEMATFNIHQDTLSYVLTAIAGTVIVILIIYLIRKYRKRTEESRPMRAATTLHQMEMASMANPGFGRRQMPFLFGKTLPQLPMFLQPQPLSPPGHQPQPATIATTAPTINPTIHQPQVISQPPQYVASPE